jgi:hypothetical protein
VEPPPDEAEAVTTDVELTLDSLDSSLSSQPIAAAAQTIENSTTFFIFILDSNFAMLVAVSLTL